MSNYSYWTNHDLNLQPQVLSGKKHDSFDYYVIDDFLDDPILARESVLAQSFEAPPNPKKAVISYNAGIPDSLADEIKEKLQSFLNLSIEFHPRSKCAATFSHVPLNQVCHVDGGDQMRMFNWTVIIYLNLPEQCQGGTRLFKHKSTGHIHNHLGWQYYAKDARDASKWEVSAEVEMKFNRALLCPAWLFHSLAFTFGSDLNDARLTINPKVIAY